MSDSDEPPFDLYDPFFDTYIELLEVLHGIGIDFSFKQRIPIFKVYTHLNELEQNDQIRYAKQLLDLLREFMERGLEPQHNGTSYV